ncbi:hypothetical protein E8L99_06385 [Phreatobacter aquaticus]|uniref:Uncharacterized protein n=1 Tax=Phreatobacter aquaticus TaxID=2570229 RepID=A0A4D7QMI7_9HYPH|nr:hypothetical protein [Phreatobacter aquaticus]QCK85422.1 hypothetical protein E8L99_06385 [Phreatobacter aquaticus]
MARKERLVHAHCDGVDYTFVPAGRITSFHLGGPLDWTVTGLDHGPRRLHAIAKLSGRAIRALSRTYLLDFPLVYGMCFGGGDMTYRLTHSHEVEVLSMSSTRSLDDWPYRGFPDLLPFVPLMLASAVPRSYADFAKRFPNLPDRPDGQLIVCVPPPATIGLSLWGSADLDGVTIVFDCDLTTATVHSYNVTT